MTQVLSCITAEAVAVAADRRLIDLGNGEVIDDEACKLILVENQMAIAYTGLANLKPPPRGQTDLWIVDTITPPPPTLNAFPHLIGHRAFERFSKIAHLGPRAKRHTFVLAGWQRTDSRSAFEPFISTISNAERPDGSWQKRADRAFRMRTAGLTEDGWRLRVSGQPLDGTVDAELRAQLQAEKSREPSTLAGLLANAVRATSRTNTAVGNSLLIAVLPMPTSAYSGTPVTSIRLDSDAPVVIPSTKGLQTYYISAGAGDAALYAPHVVARGLSIADARVYDRALSPKEIKRHYEEGKRRFE